MVRDRREICVNGEIMLCNRFRTAEALRFNARNSLAHESVTTLILDDDTAFDEALYVGHRLGGGCKIKVVITYIHRTT